MIDSSVAMAAIGFPLTAAKRDQGQHGKAQNAEACGHMPRSRCEELASGGLPQPAAAPVAF